MAAGPLALVFLGTFLRVWTPPTNINIGGLQVASFAASKAPRAWRPFQGVMRVINRKAGREASTLIKKKLVQPVRSARTPAGEESRERLRA